MNELVIKRSILGQLKNHLSKKEITLLVGPRQVGKTTLLRFLEQDLIVKGKKTIFLNLDVERDFQFVASQQSLIQHIRLSLGTDGGYVFIDEAQRKVDAGRFFKGIYDMDLPYKFILSGSGSLELKEKIHESMAGRKRVFELLPVSFWEFAAFRTHYHYGDRLLSYLAHDPSQSVSLLEEYMRFGGYPQVILASNETEKKDILNEIYQSYLIRDISFFLGVEKTDAFTNLTRVLAASIGKRTVVSELANTLGISVPTVKQYLWYLEKTYIIHRVTPFFRNPRTEISKMPTFYFYDMGLRKFAAQEGNEIMGQSGFIFENFVFLLLLEYARDGMHPIRFWRTKSGAEVDFVVDAVYPVAFEVKYASFREPTIGKSLHSFIKQYSPPNAYIITKDYAHKVVVGKTTVNFMPFHALPNISLP
ncbi:MAG: ATP-binding protein [Patescibacteria group bacterium]